MAQREHRQRFWQAIARGLSSEEAGVVAGVSSAVGTRWFREGGGLPTDDRTGVGVDDERNVDEGADDQLDVGEVGDEQSIGCIHSELAVHQIRWALVGMIVSSSVYR